MNQEQDRTQPQEGESKKEETSQAPEGTAIYSSENSTLQTPEEFQLDKARNVATEESKTEASTINDDQTKGDRLSGTDRAGTSERRPQ